MWAMKNENIKLYLWTCQQYKYVIMILIIALIMVKCSSHKRKLDKLKCMYIYILFKIIKNN